MDEQHEVPPYLDLFIDHLEPDPTPYKRFSLKLTPAMALVLRLPLDPALIEEFAAPCDGPLQDGVVIIGLPGLKAICKVITTALEDAHSEQQEARSQFNYDQPSTSTKHYPLR